MTDAEVSLHQEVGRLAAENVQLRAQIEALNEQLLDYQSHDEYENGYLDGAAGAVHQVTKLRLQLRELQQATKGG